MTSFTGVADVREHYPLNEDDDLDDKGAPQPQHPLQLLLNHLLVYTFVILETFQAHVYSPCILNCWHSFTVEEKDGTFREIKEGRRLAKSGPCQTGYINAFL
jgi:hypothetical protein